MPSGRRLPATWRCKPRFTTGVEPARRIPYLHTASTMLINDVNTRTKRGKRHEGDEPSNPFGLSTNEVRLPLRIVLTIQLVLSVVSATENQNGFGVFQWTKYPSAYAPLAPRVWDF